MLWYLKYSFLATFMPICVNIISTRFNLMLIIRSIWAAEGGEGACNYRAIKVQIDYVPPTYFHVWTSIGDVTLVYKPLAITIAGRL